MKEIKEQQKETLVKEIKEAVKETASIVQSTNKEPKKTKKKNDILAQIGKTFLFSTVYHLNLQVLVQHLNLSSTIYFDSK